MLQKTDLDVKKAQALKAVRTNIRLHYSLLADEAINRLLPEWEVKIDSALARGKAIEVDLSKIVKDLGV